MDLVYIYRQAVSNELKYSLRSIKNLDYDRVFIIGDKPKWITNIEYIEASDPYKIKSLNALHKIKLACLDDRISDDFILMNDDFYILEPTDIKYFNRGSIKDHLKYREDKGQYSSYVKNLKKTLEIFPDGLDYSLHTPIVYNKKKFLDLFKTYDMTRGYLLRNLYCNHYKVESEYMEDCKVYNLNDLNIKGKFLSSDDSIVGNTFYSFMDKLFPEPILFELPIIKMKAIANYNLEIQGIEYKKGCLYDIDPEINIKRAFGYKDYFDIVEKAQEPIIEEMPPLEINKKYLLDLLKKNGIKVSHLSKIETLINKCKENNINY